MLITPGLLTALAFIILLLKLRGDTTRKLLGFDIPLDIVATLLMMKLFAGTFAGMMAAIVGGLAFSLALIVLKKTMGYKKLSVINTEDHLIPSLRWVHVNPIWRKS